MIVGNIAGFDFIFEHNGQKYKIPNDRRGYHIPDDVDMVGFNKMLKILVPPAPKVVPSVEKYVDIMEIDLDKVNEKKIKPLKGVKIKKDRRKKLIEHFHPK